MNLKESFKLKLPDTYVSLIENNMDNPGELNVSHFMPVESELMV